MVDAAWNAVLKAVGRLEAPEDLTADERQDYETERWLGEGGTEVARKRVNFTGFVEIPEHTEEGLGWTVTFKGEGYVSGHGDDLAKKKSGDVTITETVKVTIDPKKTSLSPFKEPEGPLDAAIASAEDDD